MTVRPVAEATIRIETAAVRVTRWDFALNAETSTQHHLHDYLVVPITTGILTIETGDSVIHTMLQSGAAYARCAGVAHNVVNANSFPFSFIEVELLAGKQESAAARCQP